MKISFDHLVSLVAKAFEKHCSEANAQNIAMALVSAERDGQYGHGLSRIDSYLAQAASGKVNGQAEPTCTSDGTVDRWDAQHGFAYPAIDLAIQLLIQGDKPIAAAAIHNSHHAGQLGRHVEILADAGFVALMVANTPQAMAPWGGNQALFGTNPIAFAAPRKAEPALVIDLSLSEVARGKVVAAQKAGRTIPEGWALDADGAPTTDPNAALNGGTMVPVGGAKGAALALVVEVLAATFTGANHSNEASSFFTAEGPPPGVGQLIIALKPQPGFSERLEVLINAILGQEGTRLPGASRLKNRNADDDEVLEIDDALIARLKDG